MQQEIRFPRLRQGRAEGRHQVMRQVAHETNRIGQHDVATGHGDPAHGRIQGREQLVSRIGLGAGHRIEQGGLAGIGVAHQGHARQFAAHARTTHLGALYFDFFQPLLQLFNPLLQQATIGFQLGFTRAAQTDRTTTLALQMGPATHQTGRHMAQLGQLDLQLAFMAARTLGKDVQDQTGTVDHPALQETFQIAFLTRAQRVVDQDQICAGCFSGGLDLIQLAAAEQGRWIGTIQARGDGHRDAGPSRAGQITEFFQHIVFQLAEMRLDQQGVFALFRAVKHSPLQHHSSASSPA
ncbi:hypothetical protein D3C72_1364260 [compost metagenome]